MVTVAVLGGGISGLSTAYYLSRPAYSSIIKKVLLLESSSRFGGWMHSEKHEDGAITELGPRSIRGYGNAALNTLRLVEELGLENEILPIDSKHPANTNRFLYINKKLLPLPSGVLGGIFKRAPFKKSFATYIFRETRVPPGNAADESIHDFMSRRMGDEVAEYLIDPLVRGIFAGSSRQLSIRSCFPDLYNYEKDHGSIIRGVFASRKVQGNAAPEPSALVRKFQAKKWQLWSLRQGLGSVGDALVRELRMRPNVELLSDSQCTRLEFSEGHTKVTTTQAQVDCDHVFSSCPSKNLAPMLTSTHSQLSDKLQSIPSVTVGVVSLQYAGNVLPVTGFGHLVPSTEPSKVLGVIYESCSFPEHNAHGGATTRMTCMMGGAWFEEIFGNEDSISEETLVSAAVESIREQLGVTAEPIKVVASVLKSCIPQYVVGHADLLGEINDYIRLQQLPLHLIGASYRGVSINDCILNAKLEVDKFLAARL